MKLDGRAQSPWQRGNRGFDQPEPFGVQALGSDAFPALADGNAMKPPIEDPPGCALLRGVAGTFRRGAQFRNRSLGRGVANNFISTALLGEG